MPKIPFFLLLLAVAGCLNRAQNNNNLHIIPARVKKAPPIQNNQPPPPPPAREYYFAHNFIVDSAGDIYYYQYRNQFKECCTEDYDDLPPEFIHLAPKDIVRIPPEATDAFVKLNLLAAKNGDRWASVASAKDTIASSGLSQLLRMFRNKKYEIKFVFRKATPEEKTVLWYKQNNRHYDAEAVAWDSTKTFFPAKAVQAD
jgi:hypothetical protein